MSEINEDVAQQKDVVEDTSSQTADMTPRQIRRKQKRDKRKLERKEHTAESGTSGNSLKWIVIVGILVAVVVLMLKFVGGDDSKNGSETKVGSLTISGDEWLVGSPTSTLLLVEYSDFQCPACRSYYPIVKRLKENLPSDVRIIYRHFPLDQIHTYARIAAYASEAAGYQGKFWEMHDVIFQNQQLWSQNGAKQEELFAEYAVNIGLDLVQFEKDMKSRKAKSEVNDDYISGIQAGVNSTPSFFLNGERISVQPNYESFRALIESKLTK